MDRFDIGNLRSYYGKLLTEKQNEMIELHYDEDISFGELAEMFNVSRQAVFDAVKKGLNTLKDYESKLGLIARDIKIDEHIACLKQSLNNCDKELSLNIILDIENLLEE